MELLANVIAGITALDIYYADLPDTASSYDGTPRDISQFYDQDIPNFYLAGNYTIDRDDSISWSLNTGTHTSKLNTGSVSAMWDHVTTLNDNLFLSSSVGANLSIENHSPCVDSYNRSYVCTNLTAWSDFKGKDNEMQLDPEIRLTLTRRW